MYTTLYFILQVTCTVPENLSTLRHILSEPIEHRTAYRSTQQTTTLNVLLYHIYGLLLSVAACSCEIFPSSTIFSIKCCHVTLERKQEVARTYAH